MTVCEAAAVTQIHTIPRGLIHMITIMTTTIGASLEP